MTDATSQTQSGLWEPARLNQLRYGPSSVQKHLLDSLPSHKSKAFIITGSSLANKTNLIKKVEELLGSERHAGTFSKIRQHAPVEDVDKAADLISKDSHIDTVISVGGGSPIDSAKTLSKRSHDRTGRYLYHITIPTTLSAAECTFFSGFTNEEGKKVLVADRETSPNVVLYDATFARETPPELFLSTGLRALDHAFELMYHPTATEMPCRYTALMAISELFAGLPKYKANPQDEDVITKLQLASYASLGFLGYNVGEGGLGLSHSLGYALGSPYGIPHGITSCLTLGPVVKLKASDAANAKQIARALPFIGKATSEDPHKDAEKVAGAIDKLVDDLGLRRSLSNYKVGKDQIKVVADNVAKPDDNRELNGQLANLLEGLF